MKAVVNAGRSEVANDFEKAGAGKSMNNVTSETKIEAKPTHFVTIQSNSGHKEILGIYQWNDEEISVGVFTDSPSDISEIRIEAA